MPCAFLTIMICVLFCPVLVLMVPLLFSEPPSPPRDVMAEGSSPHSITITFLQPINWNTLIDITYNVTFHPVEDSAMLSSIQFIADVKFQRPEREEKLLEGLQVGTEYVITVTAINEFGSSLPSNSVWTMTNFFTGEVTKFARLYSGVNACICKGTLQYCFHCR